MSFLDQVKDHIFITGHSGFAGASLLILLVASGGISAGQIIVDPFLFCSILIAAALTGNGVYALNAYTDWQIDKINKSNRPIPSGRMTPKHAFRYAYGLNVCGLFLSLVISVFTGQFMVFILWSAFTLLGIAYSTPPLKLKARHILGNVCFAAFTALTFTIGNVAFGKSTGDLSTYVFSLFLYGILVVGMITMKDFHDYDGDKVKGDITFPVKIGKINAAAVSIALMSAYMFLMMALVPASRSNIWAFLDWYWAFPILIMVSFGVYIIFERFVGSALSNAYSGMQYYFTIFLVAYIFLSTPLGLNKIAWLVTWNKAIISLLYVSSTLTVMYLSWKKGLTLKPK